MTIHIRQEQESDSKVVFKLIENAFLNIEESDHQEQFLVERLHQSDTFIPELSLVAETSDKQIVGYILLTEVEIVSDDNHITTSLGLAPLAVLPEYQRQGIGGMLLNEAHRTATALGYGSVVLLGHKDYYPRFGYKRAAGFGIGFPFDVPDDCCMAIELIPGTLNHVSGTVRYPHTFFE